MGACGDFTIIADAHLGALAPDVGPPWTGGDWAQNGVFFFCGQVPGRLRGCAQFAVDFMFIGVGQQVVQEAVGWFNINDLFGCHEGGQTFLPVIVAAFDFALAQGCALHPMPINRSNASR